MANKAEVRHVGEVRDQLVVALAAGGSQLALIIHTDEVVVGTLRGNAIGGNFPHYYGNVQLLPEGGKKAEEPPR